MNPFYITENNDKTWNIECRIIVYREILKEHPDFLKQYQGNAKNGYNTKFYLLIEENIPDKNIAQRLVDDYNQKYAAIIDQCESTGNWNNAEFLKTKPVIYYK